MTRTAQQRGHAPHVASNLARIEELGALLQRALFHLHTRRFGTVAELFIKRLKALDKASSVFHDLYDHGSAERVEVKFSTVLQQSKTKLTADTLETVLREALSDDRAVSYEDWRTAAFDCNIQQVKPAEFEVLYYGLFFSDCVVVFRCTASNVEGMPGWSDKQHKGNRGEGQFHLTNKNLQLHLDKHLACRLTYPQLAQILFEL